MSLTEKQASVLKTEKVVSAVVSVGSKPNLRESLTQIQLLQPSKKICLAARTTLTIVKILRHRLGSNQETARTSATGTGESIDTDPARNILKNEPLYKLIHRNRGHSSIDA